MILNIVCVQILRALRYSTYIHTYIIAHNMADTPHKAQSLLCIPPDITMVSPVMYVASSEQRNDTVPAQSSGSPTLPLEMEIC